METKYRKTIVNIDNGEIVPNTAAYVVGYNWNGWAIPFFSKDDANKIIELYHKENEESRQTRFEWNGAALTEIYLGDGDAYTVETIIVNNETLYGVGASDWTWEEYDNGQ